MKHEDAELSDVVVVLNEESCVNVDQAVANLKAAGLSVSDVDPDNGVVEGTIESDKLHAVKKLDFVKYVRNVFTYTADFPQGDPRNQDQGDEDVDSDQADDAGA